MEERSHSHGSFGPYLLALLGGGWKNKNGSASEEEKPKPAKQLTQPQLNLQAEDRAAAIARASESK